MLSRQIAFLAALGRKGVSYEWSRSCFIKGIQRWWFARGTIYTRDINGLTTGQWPGEYLTRGTIPGFKCLTRGTLCSQGVCWMSYQGYAVKADGCTSAKPGCKAQTLVNITLGRWSSQGSRLTLCQHYVRFGEPLQHSGIPLHWTGSFWVHCLKIVPTRVHSVLKIEFSVRRQLFLSLCPRRWLAFLWALEMSQLVLS